VITVGRALLELAAGNHHGIFHLAGHSRVTRLEMAQQIARRFGLPQHLVVAQGGANAPVRAARPRDVSLNNAKACAQLETPMLTLDDGLSLIRQSAKTSAL
jgi:dTDP-4-dehydrorhamnose reductase